jgi:hypothetical protein
MDIWGRANDDCDTDVKAFWKKEEAAGTLVTSKDLCDEPWSLWIQGEKLPSNVKRIFYNSIHDPEATKNWGLWDLPDTEDIDVPARRQAAKSSNSFHLGHKTQVWYYRHREIHEVMGVQVNSEMPKIWIPLWNSSARHYL